MADDHATSALHAELSPACDRCFGLCCVALPFAASSDFAVDKPAGVACEHLDASFRCSIHDRLRPSGYTGCTVYECFGAGQRVSQGTFRGIDWRQDPATRPAMFAVFPIVRQLHELLAYTVEAAALDIAPAQRDRLLAAADEIDRVAGAPAADLAGFDVDTLRGPTNELLLTASRDARSAVRADAADLRGADLFGAKRRGADLRAASLRGAVLVGADLRDADLRSADLIGADLRGADLRGADLRDAIFLTTSQLTSARGDRRTRLSTGRNAPSHW